MITEGQPRAYGRCVPCDDPGQDGGEDGIATAANYLGYTVCMGRERIYVEQEVRRTRSAGGPPRLSSRGPGEEELTRAEGTAKRRRGRKTSSRRERFNACWESLYEDSLKK